jgi:hypothetical protein
MEFILKARANADRLFALYDELSNIENESFYDLVLDCKLEDIKVIDENTSIATMKGNCVNDIYSLLETDDFFEREKAKCLFDEQVDFEIYTFGDGFYQYCLFENDGVIKTSGEVRDNPETRFVFDNPDLDILKWIQENVDKNPK